MINLVLCCLALSTRSLSLSKFVSLSTRSLLLSRKIKTIWTPALKTEKRTFLYCFVAVASFMAALQHLTFLQASSPGSMGGHDAKQLDLGMQRTSCQNGVPDVRTHQKYCRFSASLVSQWNWCCCSSTDKHWPQKKSGHVLQQQWPR